MPELKAFLARASHKVDMRRLNTMFQVLKIIYLKYKSMDNVVCAFYNTFVFSKQNLDSRFMGNMGFEAMTVFHQQIIYVESV